MFAKKKDRTWNGFIPAGLFIGIGLGFLYDQFIVGLFLGLGAGFLLAALVKAFRKN
jgi:hypothetical protein